MRISFFGKLRDSLGDDRELAPVPGETVAGLRGRLAEQFPQAAEDLCGPRVRACVSDTIVGEDHVLAAHDRVEFLPPLSGG